MKKILLFAFIFYVAGCKKSEQPVHPIIGKWTLQERVITKYKHPGGHLIGKNELTISDGIRGEIIFESETKSDKGNFRLEGDSLFFVNKWRSDKYRYNVSGGVLTLSYDHLQEEETVKVITKEFYIKAP